MIIEKGRDIIGLIKSDYIPAFLYGEIGMNNKIDNTTKMLYFKRKEA